MSATHGLTLAPHSVGEISSFFHRHSDLPQAGETHRKESIQPTQEDHPPA